MFLFFPPFKHRLSVPPEKGVVWGFLEPALDPVSGERFVLIKILILFPSDSCGSRLIGGSRCREAPGFLAGFGGKAPVSNIPPVLSRGFSL
jgi:hypothetical protein